MLHTCPVGVHSVSEVQPEVVPAEQSWALQTNPEPKEAQSSSETHSLAVQVPSGVQVWVGPQSERDEH